MASKRVLLVEDDLDVRPLLRHVLLSAGYTVDAAETALRPYGGGRRRPLR